MKTARKRASVRDLRRYSYAKLFDDPLVKTSTSLVAGKEGASLRANVLAALGLALLFGTCQLLAFTLLAELIVAGFGAGAGSPLAAPAAAYVRLRALGAPAVTLLLVMQERFLLGRCTCRRAAIQPSQDNPRHLPTLTSLSLTRSCVHCRASSVAWVIRSRLSFVLLLATW